MSGGAIYTNNTLSISTQTSSSSTTESTLPPLSISGSSSNLHTNSGSNIPSADYATSVVTTTTTSSSSISSSKGVAAFIASGLGLGTSTSDVASTTSQAAVTYVRVSYSTTSTASGTGLAGSTNLTAGSGFLSASASSNRSTIYSSSNFSSPTGSSSLFNNFTYTGDCWAQWNQFWTLESSVESQSETSTYTTTTVETLSLFTFWTSEILVTVIVTVYDGAFAQTTFTTISTSESLPTSAAPTTTITTVETFEDDSPSRSTAIITHPPCVLPSIVAQCQSSWDDWAIHQYSSPNIPDNGPSGCSYGETASPCGAEWSTWSSIEDAWDDGFNAPPPKCSQASVSGSICSGLISSYLSVAEEYDGEVDGHIGEATTFWTSNGIGMASEYWPSSSTFAPGCSLGCQNCRIDGGTVQLLYWSPVTDSIRNATEIVTSVGLGTTFTSPTVYISFDSLYASDSCGAIGPTYSNTIVAITNTADLSSLYGWGYHNELQQTTSFNFTDLYVTPVPDSIYESQPRCVSSSLSLAAGLDENGIGIPANWTCPRTLPYLPILAVPMEVRTLNSLWASCIGGINGVYDPPKVLTSEGTVLAPTVAWATTTTMSTAEPASSLTTSSAPSTVPAQRPSALSSSDASADAEATSLVKASSKQSIPTELSASGLSTSNEDTFKVSQISAAAQDPATTTNALDILSQAEATFDSSDLQLAGSTTSNSFDIPTQTVPLSQASAATTIRALYTDDIPAGSTDVGSSVTVTNALFVTAVNDPASSGRVSIAGQTLDVGGSVISIASTPISLAPSGLLVIGSSPLDVPPLGATMTIELGSSPIVNAAPFSIGDQTFTAQLVGSAIVVDSQTLIVGGPAATLNGQHISAGSSGVVVGSGVSMTTVPLIEGENDPQDQSLAGPQTVVTVGSELYTASTGPNGLSMIAHDGSTVTLSAGSPSATIDGQVFSAVSGHIVVGSGSQASTIAIGPSAEISNTVTIGSQIYTELPQTSGAYVLADQETTITIAPGEAAASINGQVVSAVSDGIVVGSGIKGDIISLTTIDKTSNILSIGSQTFTEIAQTGNVAVFADGQTTFTLNPGGAATTIDSEIISAASDGNIVIGSSALTLAPISTLNQPEATSVITVGSETFTLVAQPSDLEVFANAQTTLTLSVGGPATTINNQVISAAGTDEVVVGSSTIRVSLNDQVLTLGSQTATISPDSNGVEIVDLGSSTVTLSPGRPVATIGSLVVSEASDGSITVVANTGATSTSSASQPATTKTSGATSRIPVVLRGSRWVLVSVACLVVTLNI